MKYTRSILENIIIGIVFMGVTKLAPFFNQRSLFWNVATELFSSGYLKSRMYAFEFKMLDNLRNRTINWKPLQLEVNNGHLQHLINRPQK